MKTKINSIVAICSLLSVAAFASDRENPLTPGGGGGSEGHGGSAVVCFELPAGVSASEGYVDSEGLISAAGLRSMISAETLEFRLAKMAKHWNPKAERLFSLPYEEALQGLRDLFKVAPETYYDLLRAHEFLGEIAQGTEAPDGLGVVKDTGALPNFGKNCPVVQTVIRRSDVFYFHSMIWAHASYSGFQKALMQLHEELYYIGATEYGHMTSENTQNLIVYLLTHDFGPGELVRRISRYQFGEGMGLDDAKSTILLLENAEFIFSRPVRYCKENGAMRTELEWSAGHVENYGAWALQHQNQVWKKSALWSRVAGIFQGNVVEPGYYDCGRLQRNYALIEPLKIELEKLRAFR